MPYEIGWRALKMKVVRILKANNGTDLIPPVLKLLKSSSRIWPLPFNAG